MRHGPTKKAFTGYKTKLGIIDSGSGGLTIAKAISLQHPGHDIHYFGDHKYLPYGNKTETFLRARIKYIAKYLESKDCTHIILACHTASATLHKQKFDFTWSGVVTPTIEKLASIKKSSKIAIIGTAGTINSGIYRKYGQQLITPLLAQRIEQKATIDIKQNIHEIADFFGKIDYLVLACTHYPLAIEHFNNIMPNTKIINTPILTASSLQLPISNLNSEIVIESSLANNSFLESASVMLPNSVYLESVL